MVSVKTGYCAGPREKMRQSTHLNMNHCKLSMCINERIDLLLHD